MRLRNLRFVLFTDGPKTWDIEIRGRKVFDSRGEFSIHHYGGVKLELFRNLKEHQGVTRRSGAGNSHSGGIFAAECCLALLSS